MTKQFYQHIGFSWKSVRLPNQTYAWFFRKNVYFVIPEFEYVEKDVKLFFMDKSNELLLKISGEDYCLQPEEADCFLISHLLSEIHNHEPYDSAELESPDLIPIIRHPSIDGLKLNYEILGVWKKEKHGTGPTHYCLDNENLTIELYPARKKSLGLVELVVQNANPDIDSMSEYLLRSTENLLSFIDPDGLSVNTIVQESPRHVFRR